MKPTVPDHLRDISFGSTRIVRRSPSVVEAVQWNGDRSSLLMIQDFMQPSSPLFHWRDEALTKKSHQPYKGHLLVITHDKDNEIRYPNLGPQFAMGEVRIGDWIYKDGEAFGIIRKDDYEREWQSAEAQERERPALPLDLKPYEERDE